MKSKLSRKNSQPKVVVNRRARFDYTLGDELIVGIELTGAEVKAARFGKVSLTGAYVVTRRNSQKNNSELYLINAGFTLENNARGVEKHTTFDDRQRKLLAKRKEIDSLVEAKNSGLTIIPTKLLAPGRYIKLVIALGKGKKNYDKRHAIRERDLSRETQRLAKL